MRAWIILEIMVITSGCVRTGGVGSYARAAGETAAEFPALAEEMTASCARLEGYREAREGKGWADGADLEKSCADRERAVRRAVAVDRALASYFAALGALADGKVVKYDASIDDLADALEDDAKLDRKKVRAVSDLAEFAASVATDGYRHLELTRVIEDQNANVAAVIDALADIVGQDYANILDLEAAGHARNRSEGSRTAKGESRQCRSWTRPTRARSRATTTTSRCRSAPIASPTGSGSRRRGARSWSGCSGRCSPSHPT